MARAAASGVTPIMVRSFFFPLSKANETMTGRPVDWAALRAIPASSRSLMVSTSSASAPASASAAACAANAAATSSRPTSPFMRSLPVGPMEANTRALPAAARLEISTPARLMAVKLAGQAGPLERDPVRTERVGQDHLAAGFHVGAGHGFHGLGTLQVPGIGQNAGRQPEGQ